MVQKKESLMDVQKDCQAVEKGLERAVSLAVAHGGVQSIVDNFYQHLRFEELTKYVKPFASSKTVSNMRLVILGPSDERKDDNVIINEMKQDTLDS